MPNYFKQGAVDLAAAGGGGDSELLLPAPVFQPGTGSPTLVRSTTANTHGWTMGAIDYTSVVTLVKRPQWESLSLDYLLGTGNTAGNVVLAPVMWQIDAAGAIIEPGVTFAPAATFTLHATGSSIQTYSAGTVVLHANAKFLRVSMQRQGPDAADTMPTDLFMFGARLTKA